MSANNTFTAFNPNEAQQEIIDEVWENCSLKPPTREHQRMAVDRCNEVGPSISSQTLGLHYSHLADESRFSPKDPEQLDILKKSWDKDAYPSTGEHILLVYDTGLTHSQVKSWFQREREKAKKRGQQLLNRNRNDRYAVRRMWQSYQAEPESFVEGLRSGRINPSTGKEITQDAEDDGDEDDKDEDDKDKDNEDEDDGDENNGDEETSDEVEDDNGRML